ncbi:MAG TPA: rhomboid family intramembrane serine protease [Steroidobacteraceae bacterium]|nr:rhomboid family intramembrane serine protease [Steroidobacteraceae bacterium]
MTLPSSDTDHIADPPQAGAVVFRGSQSLCREFSLVLEAQGIEHAVQETAASWVLTVAPDLVHRAYEEISRYSAERSAPRRAAHRMEPLPGAAIGAIGYVLILLLTAYCAGLGLFGADWLALGALDLGARGEWWRAVTALTLHLDQEHLLGNLLFGVVAGMGAGRLLGPGVAWASILAAGALANYVEILVAPDAHRAVGASTAVFAALGLLTGLAWRQRLTIRERRWYAVAPLIAGICLLTLLGAGNAHVDVLGHALGFLFGVGVGWLYARAGMPRNRGKRLQIVTGAVTAVVVCAAWILALWHAV